MKIDAGTKSEIDINKLNRAGELEMQSNGTAFLETTHRRTISSLVRTS